MDTKKKIARISLSRVLKTKSGVKDEHIQSIFTMFFLSVFLSG